MPIEKPLTIREQVYKILKNSICDGEFKPGEWLQEKELAAKLNVSRSPIREALHSLVSDGLAVEIPNKGVFVKTFTPKDIDEIFDLRVMLENYAISKSKNNITSKQVNNLLDTLSKLEFAYNENNLLEYTSIDSSLHSQIISLSGNSLLESTYNQLGSMISQFRIYSLSENQRFVESFYEHKSLIDNIITGDIKKAMDINSQHLNLAKIMIVKHIENLEKH